MQAIHTAICPRKGDSIVDQAPDQGSEICVSDSYGHKAKHQEQLSYCEIDVRQL